MKNQVIEKLTSSKNERIAFELIWDKTMFGDKQKTLKILNHEFESAGISGRKSICAAIKRLKEKNLVRKFKELLHNYPHDVYVYNINLRGVVTFLEKAA